MNRHIQIVDGNDNPISAKPTGSLAYADIYRVSALWLTDKKTGDALLAQRKWTKKNDPGKWGTAVAGTVEADETYESNIAKEIEEEIGLKGLELESGPKTYTDDGSHKFFCQWFFGQVDKDAADIVIQEEEVEAVRWISIERLLDNAGRNPDNYTPSFSENLRTFGLS